MLYRPRLPHILLIPSYILSIKYIIPEAESMHVIQINIYKNETKRKT